MDFQLKKGSKPDEVRPAGRGRAEIFHFEGRTIGRTVFEPGWRWTQDVGPIAGTASCEAFHTCYVVSGRIRVRAKDGTETEAAAGDLFIVKPGHDAWVVGNEPCVMLDFTGMEHYAVRPQETGASAH